MRVGCFLGTCLDCEERPVRLITVVGTPDEVANRD